jgi:Uncharacterized conserved protein (DUF2190)
MPTGFGVSIFRYVGIDPTSAAPGEPALGQQNGGIVDFAKATSAIARRDVVAIDASNANQVVTAPTSAAAAIAGVCVGRLRDGQIDLDNGPGAGDLCVIQISGTCEVVADGNIAIGASVIASTSTAGRVLTVGGTTTQPTVIGTAWAAGAAAGVLRIRLRL